MAKSERWKEWAKLYNESSYANKVNQNQEPIVDSEMSHQLVSEEDQEFFIGFSKRFYAFVIDSLILSLFLMEIGNFTLLLLIYSLYYAIFTSSPLRGTIGKLAIGAVVVDENGERLTFLRALLRFYAYSLSTISCLLGYFMIVLDDQ